MNLSKVGKELLKRMHDEGYLYKIELEDYDSKVLDELIDNQCITKNNNESYPHMVLNVNNAGAYFLTKKGYELLK